MGKRSAEDKDERRRRKDEKRARKEERRRAQQDETPAVNEKDAASIVSTLVDVYPTARDELRALFEVIDSGEPVDIQGIEQDLVRESLSLLFTCVRLERQGQSFVRGQTTPKLCGLFAEALSSVEPSAADDHMKADRRVIGPQLPTSADIPTGTDDNNHIIDSDDEEFGPSLTAPPIPRAPTTVEVEPVASQRESWMTALPEDRAGVSSADAMAARKFTRKGISDLGDRSVWTDSAAERQRKFEERLQRKSQKAPNKAGSSKSKPAAPVPTDSSRPSLLAQHQSLKSAAQPERRAADNPVWDRERDLVGGGQITGRKFHDMVSQAKQLGSRFSSSSTL
ncbi:DUF3752 domain-containing protein [Plasmodiophora brassicae]|uniref:DUF3752 domain-containing protein n=1 Tax=Plasmodiophora brassicae TaxID=37360 RepID=A0A0G4J6X6_PLABS|nr:hypothetical protein PBRA_003085 [Plasmodiophora brassicae]